MRLGSSRSSRKRHRLHDPDLDPFRDVAKRAVHQKLVTDPAQKAILDEIEKL